MLRRILCLSGLLLALGSTGLFVAAGVKVWSVRNEVKRQTEYLASRANVVGTAAENAISFVRQALDRAEADLARTRLEVQRQPPQPVNPILRLTARQASQQLVGSVQRAQGAVEAASEAIVIADAVLDVVNDFPELKKLFGVDQTHVERTRYALSSVAEELRQARSLLGVPIEGEVLSLEQLGNIDAALHQARWYTDEMDKVLETARNRINELRARIDRLADRVAVAVTAACALALVGHVFLARFCLRRLYGLPA
jgi:PAS domain-containing protein